MPKILAFSIQGFVYNATPEKIDRKKLYGWQKTIILDQEGNECSPASTADFGTLILPAGGIGSGIISPEGEWVERSSLVAVNPRGERVEILPSSYSATNLLTQKIPVEEILNYNITGVYQLKGEMNFASAIGEYIWTFPYRYRDSHESISAFIIQSDGIVFMLLGVSAGIEMITLEQIAIFDDEDDEGETEEDDEIDFSFI